MSQPAPELQEGCRCYSVWWTKGQPSIEHGIVVLCGKNKKTRKAMMSKSPKPLPISEVFPTIREAIAREITTCADMFLGKSFPRHKPEPWQLVSAIIRLMRLLRQLEKRHLA